MTDTIGSTLSSNQFTLPAGTYQFDGWSTANSVVNHQSKLYNVTDAADVLIGTNARVDSANMSSSIVRGQFTMQIQKHLSLDQDATQLETMEMLRHGEQKFTLM